MHDDYHSLACKRTLDAEPVHDATYMLWQASLDIARHRVESVIKFAREWNEIRFDHDYEMRRHRALFHLEWLLNDDDSQRFTFRTLCEFSKAEDLGNVRAARQRILQMFSSQAMDSLRKPINDSLLKQVASQWVSNGPTVHAVNRRGERPKIDDEPVAEYLEPVVVAEDEWDLED